ncbi:hypothetical protein [Jannaschia sp. 2305UL9-9]|uniref:hypothetical protein n=1 Tax=Jannaschia sp. 2305UL9-9 TaxID=3121638 RepID=UPI0035288384
MTITLFAQPYDISANGFYFTSTEDYEAKVRTLKTTTAIQLKSLKFSSSTVK